MKQKQPLLLAENHSLANTQAAAPAKPAFLRRGLTFGSLAALLILTGCGYSGFPLTGATPPVQPGDIGNWQVTAVSTAGTSPFSALAGWIDEPKSTSGASVVTQSVFQATPDKSACYSASTTLPSEGTLVGTALVLNGFSVNGQYLTINATQDATATHFNGTYAVRGGCAGGAAGTVTGTRYDALTGTYQGTLAGGASITLISTQDEYPNGSGYFPISGTANITGSSCLTSATIDENTSYVIGSAVSLALVSPSGLRLTIAGTFSTDATSVTVTSAVVSGGSCSGTFGAGTLQRN
jgi:hypothetical protein